MSTLFRTVLTGGLWLSSASTAAACGTSTESSLTVHTGVGAIHGTINGTSPHVRQFLGIPFAEPPVGALRFQPPVRHVSQGGANASVDATAFAASCIQPLTAPEAAAASVYNVFMPEFTNARPEQSEDCLYLNVFAPLKPVAAKLPVLIWIYGGGFSSNSAEVPYQAPDPWIERTQGHIVVTFNYRVNIFGFPNAAGQSLNAGLLDQRLAVEWVRDNIAAFGGDVDRMVLWGQSAGAWSVNYYGYAYPTDPIVSGLIADSGGSTVYAGGDPAHRNFSAVAAQAGCAAPGDDGDDDDDDGAAAELACMQRVDAATVRALASNTTGVRFGPGADNATVFADVAARARDGRVARLPAILGVNSREGSGFAPWTAEAGVEEADVVESSKIIVCPTLAEIENRLAGGLTTYRYLYSGNFSNIAPRPWIGAVHSGELPLIFGTHAQYRGNSTEFEWEVSEAMQDLWLSFASNATADPTYGDFIWPKYDPAAATVASLAADGVAVQLGDSAVGEVVCP